jgi:hypothetical protein
LECLRQGCSSTDSDVTERDTLVCEDDVDVSQNRAFVLLVLNLLYVTGTLLVTQQNTYEVNVMRVLYRSRAA